MFTIVYLKGIQNLLKAAKECLRDNFQSFFQVLSGMCMAMHFEELIALQAECPMVLAYSETPGTGKYSAAVNGIWNVIIILKGKLLLYRQHLACVELQ